VNWKRGLLQLWLALSVLWVGVSVGIFLTELIRGSNVAFSDKTGKAYRIVEGKWFDTAVRVDEKTGAPRYIFDGKEWRSIGGSLGNYRFWLIWVVAPMGMLVLSLAFTVDKAGHRREAGPIQTCRARPKP
jgi:hypothetical protein